MCGSCGCSDPRVVPVEVETPILTANDALALRNRRLFASRAVLAINLMGSPGSGKTAVLEAVARKLSGSKRLAAIAGDLATELDAERLRAAGVSSVSVQTGSACHLDAAMVHGALDASRWAQADYLFIENVGNLVCPAVYDLGQHANVVVLSVTEGEDKPLKYPVMFSRADLVLLTKVDLLPHLNVQPDHIHHALARVMPEPRLIALSTVRGWGVERFVNWLESRHETLRRARAATLAS